MTTATAEPNAKPKRQYKLRWLGEKGHPIGSHIQVEIPDEISKLTIDELIAKAKDDRINPDLIKGNEHNRRNLLNLFGIEKLYMAGQTVWSEENLAARWPEKFEQVAEYQFSGPPMSYEEALAKGIITAAPTSLPGATPAQPSQPAVGYAEAKAAEQPNQNPNGKNRPR